MKLKIRGEINHLTLEDGFYYFEAIQIFCQIEQRTHIPKSASAGQIFRSFPQGELNVSLQRRSPPRVVIWLSQTSRPFTFSRGFSSLFYCVKSIDRLDRNRHGCHIWSNGQKRGWKNDQTDVVLREKVTTHNSVFTPVASSLLPKSWFFSYWKLYIPWLDKKKKKEGSRKKIRTREVFLFFCATLTREI